MPYTYKSVAFTWLIILALFAVSASGVARGWWFVLLLAVAVAAPALVLRNPVVATVSPERPLIVADERARSPLNLDGIDVLRWENDGGARQTRLRDRVREPVRAPS
jgi:hypothetical protein